MSEQEKLSIGGTIVGTIEGPLTQNRRRSLHFCNHLRFWDNSVASAWLDQGTRYFLEHCSGLVWFHSEVWNSRAAILRRVSTRWKFDNVSIYSFAPSFQSVPICPRAQNLLILKFSKPPSKFNLKINKENVSVCADASWRVMGLDHFKLQSQK